MVSPGVSIDFMARFAFPPDSTSLVVVHSMSPSGTDFVLDSLDKELKIDT